MCFSKKTKSCEFDYNQPLPPIPNSELPESTIANNHRLPFKLTDLIPPPLPKSPILPNSLILHESPILHESSILPKLPPKINRTTKYIFTI